MLEFAIEEASAKTRTGPPLDAEEDYELAVWAGIVPMELRSGTPMPDPRQAAQTTLPKYLNGQLNDESPVVDDDIAG